MVVKRYAIFLKSRSMNQNANFQLIFARTKAAINEYVQSN